MADYAFKEDESPAAASEMRLGWLRDALALPADEQPAASVHKYFHGFAPVSPGPA